MTRMDAMKLCAPVARWEIERPEVEAEAEEMAEQMGIEGAYSPAGATEGVQ